MTDHVKKCPFCVEGLRLPRGQQARHEANLRSMANNEKPQYKITWVTCTICGGTNKILPDSSLVVDMFPGDPILRGGN